MSRRAGRMSSAAVYRVSLRLHVLVLASVIVGDASALLLSGMHAITCVILVANLLTLVARLHLHTVQDRHVAQKCGAALWMAGQLIIGGALLLAPSPHVEAWLDTFPPEGLALAAFGFGLCHATQGLSLRSELTLLLAMEAALLRMATLSARVSVLGHAMWGGFLLAHRVCGAVLSWRRSRQELLRLQATTERLEAEKDREEYDCRMLARLLQHGSASQSRTGQSGSPPRCFAWWCAWQCCPGHNAGQAHESAAADSSATTVPGSQGEDAIPHHRIIPLAELRRSQRRRLRRQPCSQIGSRSPS